MNQEELNRVTQGIIGAAIEVHRHLGPGLLESAYDECLCYELSQAGLSFQGQVAVPVGYKGLKLDCNCLLVGDSVVVEIKAIEQMLPVHPAQLPSYLKATDKDGVKRVVNDLPDSSLRVSQRLSVYPGEGKLQ